jgi:phage I-like protein
MKKLKRSSKLNDVANNLEGVLAIKSAMSFLKPELSDEEIKTQLVYLLALVADTKELQDLVASFNEQGEQKVKEVCDLYEMFSVDTNNN